MRKALAVMLIGGSLAAGVSTAFANDRDQIIDSAPSVTGTPAAIATSSAAAGETTGSAWIRQPEHDAK